MNEEHLDGTGGGLGRYRGVSLKEMERLYDLCRKEGGMRGLSAVLRIAREQLDARGGLGSYPWLALLCLVAAGAIWFFPFTAGPLKDWRMQGVIGALFLFVLFGWISWTTRIERRQALYQEAKIREMSVQALIDILLIPDFKPKALDATQRLTLERLLKKTKRTDPILLDLLGG